MMILDKNLMILASAGSGKTYQLSNRVIGLTALGADPRAIAALTFTRKAAGEFADEILSKLAQAAGEEGAAARLREETGVSDADFAETLQRVVRALPEMTLGTLDGFFTRVVRGFQYELGLTGGAFALLEGAAQAAAVDEILAGILRDALGGEEGEEFLHAFRRATAGREERRIVDLLREFVATWHALWRDGVPEAEWGPAVLLGEGEPETWGAAKGRLLGPLRQALDGVTWTDKRQRGAFEKVLDAMEEHTTGSGVLGKAPSLFGRIVEAAAGSSGELALTYQKPFTVAGRAADLLREAVRAAACAELAAALDRTRAICEIVKVFDAACERRLRRRGMLGFDDVKRLMGQWVSGEEARLRREAVDFRLDARYQHWLLDEFQDTSRAEWVGIEPLLDEAASGEESSLFIVGDKKQAIYGWRGGEVALFDEARARYGRGMRVETMPVSWRACPQVLDLVNQVCGDRETMAGLFGEEAAARWEWEEHEAAPPRQADDQRGEARVETVEGQREERLARMVEVMRELGVGQREMTCGVLVRTNSELRLAADGLRSAGYEVIEEGRRRPCGDNGPGLALRCLVHWLAYPADRHAWGVVGMSPFGTLLTERYGDAWQAAWEGLLEEARLDGLAGMAEGMVEPFWPEWSEFGRRRAGDVIAALAGIDALGGTVREAARLLPEIEVAQAPGVAAVQVMTIHKAKGLGFDVVMLPEISDEQVPKRGHFDKADGEGWLSEMPADWARDLTPELVEAESRWRVRERYESFCVLYVALTRARRGVYVFLPAPPKSRKAGTRWASLAEWVSQSCGLREDPAATWSSGRRDWADLVPAAAERPRKPSEAPLGAARPRRARLSPSAAKGKEAAAAATGSAAGRSFGSEVHRLFERVRWVDDGLDHLGSGPAADLVRACLATDEIVALFEEREGLEVLREVPLEIILDGKWMSGVVDRLHVFRDSGGAVVRCEVIDFKTDRVESGEELVERYRGQTAAYRRAVGRILDLPEASVSCLLVSTGLKKIFGC